ncbi:type II toxin-antitoxin system PemK/MazF family toxin [Streptomyces iconiensis]|uniref:Type II toxin-antitoxin system PemK/MazF family toxin n=1 Tax=Streptomyces iconiensis TaxID=1384038 RepID=A0ABT6ZX84_9ACTN|nr:type II toxin-antitoxin system PemK/MazF family toxin [Streptomyces iconiensis]MDJ1133241.1 type II toxin-antitoxin system PemK/MazF family toxin [Streptomyces iconiensis]
MDTSWWLALGGVVLLAFVAALVDARGRLGPRRRGARAVAAAAVRDDGEPLPRPGEIWRTELPDGDEQPFLVLAVRSDGARVARLTTAPRSSSALPVPLPVLPPDDTRLPVYYTAEGGLAEVGLARLLHRMGEVAPETWEQIRHLAD